jgi:hypothetical protein
MLSRRSVNERSERTRRTVEASPVFEGIVFQQGDPSTSLQNAIAFFASLEMTLPEWSNA